MPSNSHFMVFFLPFYKGRNFAIFHFQFPPTSIYKYLQVITNKEMRKKNVINFSIVL